jgi:hypothetical protein
MLQQYIIPAWLSNAFLIAIPLPFFLIILWIRKESLRRNNKLWIATAVFFAAYVAYISLASYNGWFAAVSLPPRVLLLTTFPYAFFLFVIVYRIKGYKALFETTALHLLVGLHIFRLIGVFFILLALQDALPKPFAFIAGIGDMVTALSSILVAAAIRKKKSYAPKLTLYWNIFGTIDILFTAIAANVITKLSIDNGTMGVDSLAAFPFCIIPAFAPPTILFLHWLIFKQLKKNS